MFLSNWKRIPFFIMYKIIAVNESSINLLAYLLKESTTLELLE
jgi:hypothetical protein